MGNGRSSYLLGIDQGTTQTTAVVIDEQGRIVAQNSVQVPIHFPQPGWVEQDPWDILQSVHAAVAPLIKAYAITGVGFDNQGETFVLWDSQSGQPLTPAIVWQDKRGETVCQTLANQVDANWLHQKTGLLLDSYFSAPKLRFMLENDPELRAMAANGRLRFGTTETWVLWHLSAGQLHVTDPSTASRTLLFNINQLDWDDDLLDLFDIPRAILPQVHPSSGFIGSLNFGSGPDIPLYALLVDQQAALFGQACFTPGDMKCTLGTGSFLLMNSGAKPRYDAPGLLATLAWQLPSQTTYALDGGIFVAGAAVQWLVESLKLLPNAAASGTIAAQSTDPGVTFVPALSGLAAPHWQTDVRGAMFGLGRDTTPADIARATLEGIACRVYEVVTAMNQAARDKDRPPPTHLKVDGGPSANKYLMQFLADLLNMEIQVAAVQEATALGMAHLAAHAAWGISLADLAARWQATAVYTPQIEAAKREEQLHRWQRALNGLQHFYNN